MKKGDRAGSQEAMLDEEYFERVKKEYEHFLKEFEEKFLKNISCGEIDEEMIYEFVRRSISERSPYLNKHLAHFLKDEAESEK